MTPVPQGGMDASALADVLQLWVADLPRWELGPPEEWVPFLFRYQQAELHLVRMMRRLPACDLVVTGGGRYVHLSLAGIDVRSRAGLIGTCRIWIAAARSRTTP